MDRAAKLILGIVLTLLIYVVYLYRRLSKNS